MKLKNNWLLTVTCLSVIYTGTGQNVGIGTSNPLLARLQVNGSVGAAVAIFGADKFGVAIEADNPEVGFNYYFNNGTRTIKAGPAALIGMNPGSGDLYFGNFNGNVSATDGGTISGYRTAMVLKQSGRIGIGVDNPTRAAVEQNGAVVNTAALFGGDGKGVSIQRDWPAIGLNHYFDGQHRSIGGGYGAQIGVDQNTGSIYFAQFSNNAPVPNGLLLNPNAAIHFKAGKIGVNTNDPQAAIHVHDIETTNSTKGIRFSSAQYSNSYWNLYGAVGLIFTKNGSNKAYVSDLDGSWNTYSDQRLKKNILPYDENVVDKLMQLHPSKYQMKNESEESSLRHIGFMAQELQSVFPEVVTEDENGMKMVNYAGLVPMLTKAIQEQQKLIEKQQGQINWLLKKVQLANQ